MLKMNYFLKNVVVEDIAFSKILHHFVEKMMHFVVALTIDAFDAVLLLLNHSSMPVEILFEIFL
jgi:hypothetical protein